MTKYKLTDETKTVGGVTLHRIQALKDFADIKAGELGGWVEKEENLSHDGDAWVCDNANVSKSTHIFFAGPIGSRNAITTFFRNKDNTIRVACGCFQGPIENFIEKVNETHGDSKHGKTYRMLAELAKAQIELDDM